MLRYKYTACLVQPWSQLFWTSSLFGGNQSVSRPICLNLRNTNRGSHWISECVGPHSYPGVFPYKESNLIFPGVPPQPNWAARPEHSINGNCVNEETDAACNETNLMHYLSSLYWVTTTLHVSGLLLAHHQEAASYICDNWYVLYVLVDCRRAWMEWKINRASGWFHYTHISRCTLNKT
jgi:hypothetical protein